MSGAPAALAVRRDPCCGQRPGMRITGARQCVSVGTTCVDNTIPQSSCPASTAPCLSQTGCSSCLNLAGCAWCSDPALCVAYDTFTTRFSMGQCKNYFYSTNNKCTDGASVCSAQTTCTACLAQSLCGWCSQTQKCLYGDWQGPVAGSGTCGANWTSSIMTDACAGQPTVAPTTPPTCTWPCVGAAIAVVALRRARG